MEQVPHIPPGTKSLVHSLLKAWEYEEVASFMFAEGGNYRSRMAERILQARIIIDGNRANTAETKSLVTETKGLVTATRWMAAATWAVAVGTIIVAVVT